MKKVYLTFLLALVLISSVSALSIKQNSIHDTIIPQFNQPAEIQLIITGAEAGSYNLYTLTDVKITPTSNFNLHTGTNTVTTYIYPTDSLDARGIYSFSYALKKLDGQTYEDAMTVKVKDIQDAIEISSDSNNPDDGKLTFYIKNKENTDIQDLKVKLSSIFFEFEERFDLPPYEKKFFTVDVDKNLLKTSEAGSYLVKAEIKTDKGDQELIGKLFIGEKKGIDTTEDKSGILTRTTTITKINTGNVVESITVRVERGFFTKFFTTFSPAPTLVDKQGLTSIYLWKPSNQ